MWDCSTAPELWDKAYDKFVPVELDYGQSGCGSRGAKSGYDCNKKNNKQTNTLGECSKKKKKKKKQKKQWRTFLELPTASVNERQYQPQLLIYPNVFTKNEHLTL